MNDEKPTARDARAGGDERRALFVVRAGGRLFAVPAEEVEAAAEGLKPAPLPFAPPAVLGVVSLRGRMRTALDPLRLAPREDLPAAHAAADENPPADAHAPATAPTPAAPAPRLFVALRGDEQLALACDSAEGIVEIDASQLAPAGADAPAALAAFEHGGAPVTLLDPARLFEAAMLGTERRRRRT